MGFTSPCMYPSLQLTRTFSSKKDALTNFTSHSFHKSHAPVVHRAQGTATGLNHHTHHLLESPVAGHAAHDQHLCTCLLQSRPHHHAQHHHHPPPTTTTVVSIIITESFVSVSYHNSNNNSNTCLRRGNLTFAAWHCEGPRANCPATTQIQAVSTSDVGDDQLLCGAYGPKRNARSQCDMARSVISTSMANSVS